MEKPLQKPQNCNFSSGPCAKRPGWKLLNLESALTGRSHRSGPGKNKLKEVIDLHKEILQIPDDYHLGILPASDTGALELALWNFLGARDVDVLAWESFGMDWLNDVVKELQIPNVNQRVADYGALPDLNDVNFENDVVFVWNGTTSGVRVPNGEWIKSDRAGLTICDATSAVFAYDLDWSKLDVVTWSWQKALGSEAGFGMLLLSPRAVDRLRTFSAPRPLPKIFRIKKGDGLNEGIFKGLTINTPSMIAVEDCLDALRWVQSLGGVNAAIKRSKSNYDVLHQWVIDSSWAEFLASDPNVRSTTSMTLKVVDPWFMSLSPDLQADFIVNLCNRMDKENVAKDIKYYRSAPPGLRIWGGATIDSSDIEILTEWLDWAFELEKEEYKKQAA